MSEPTGQQSAGQQATPQPVVIKDGDNLCVVDNQLQKVPLSGEFYYLSGTPEGVLKGFEKSLQEMIPQEVKEVKYPVPGTYKNVIVEEIIPLFMQYARALLPKANDPKMAEAMTHSHAGVFHILHRMVHILRGSGDVNSALKLIASVSRPEPMGEKGGVAVAVADLPWDDVNGYVGDSEKTLAHYFDDKPDTAQLKTRSTILRMRMNSLESGAFEADNRAMADNLRKEVVDENKFLFDAFLKTLSEQPFLRGLSSPLVRNRAVYAILNRIAKGVTDKEERYTVLQNATLQSLGQALSKFKTEEEFNNWYQEFVR